MSAAHPNHLDRYLLRGEDIVVAVHRHWATVLGPVALAFAGIVAAFVVSITVTPRMPQIADLPWWLAFALIGRAAFYVWEWRREWFVATDRRLLLIYGFIVRKVDMMPLGKVTDMTYHRTVPGRLLGYGTFVLESAGQDQALSRLEFMPHPDSTYTAIIAQIFHRDGDAEVEPEVTGEVEELVQERARGRVGRQGRALFTQLSRVVTGRREFENAPGPVQQRRGLSRPAGASPGTGPHLAIRGRSPQLPVGPLRSRGSDGIASQDEDTAAYELGGLSRHGGHTLYDSDVDGTHEPDYGSYGDDPTAWPRR